MAKEPKQLDELFVDTLKDIYFAEKKILAALPKMAKAAQNEDLKAAFEKHEAENRYRVWSRCSSRSKPSLRKNCPAIIGIIEEGQEIIKEYKGSSGRALRNFSVQDAAHVGRGTRSSPGRRATRQDARRRKSHRRGPDRACETCVKQEADNKAA